MAEKRRSSEVPKALPGRLAAGPEPLAEVGNRPRPEGDIDERIPLEDPLPLSLGIAAADRDHPPGVAILQRLGLRQVRGEALVGLLPDRAGIEDDDVGILLRDRLPQPEGLEHALDPLRIVGVHLAAEGRDVIPLHGRHRSPAGCSLVRDRPADRERLAQARLELSERGVGLGAQRIERLRKE